MKQKTWMCAREAAEYLNITKPQVFRLLKENKLSGKLFTDTPVPFYKIETTSIIYYKNNPKNKGGRPKGSKVDKNGI